MRISVIPSKLIVFNILTMIQFHMPAIGEVGVRLSPPQMQKYSSMGVSVCRMTSGSTGMDLDSGHRCRLKGPSWKIRSIQARLWLLLIQLRMAENMEPLMLSQNMFGDFRLHVEYLVMKPGGNSGVSLQNRYAIQILDGDRSKHGMGAVISGTPTI